MAHGLCDLSCCVMYVSPMFVSVVCLWQQFAKNVFGVLQSIKIREEGGTRQPAAEVTAPASVSNSQPPVSTAGLSSRLKVLCIALHGKRFESHGAKSNTCHMGSHSVTCHPTRVNVPHLNPSQTGQWLGLPTLEGWKAQLTWLVGHVGLLVCRQSPVQIVTGAVA